MFRIYKCNIRINLNGVYIEDSMGTGNRNVFMNTYFSPKTYTQETSIKAAQ
jgi:hypothetical protein